MAMKVVTIEVAEAIEKEFRSFLKDWGGGYQLRFARFIDLGGKQTDLYVYLQNRDEGPWMVARIKSAHKSDQGECMQYFVEMTESGKSLEDVLVSPEVWKLPALSSKILEFCKADLLAKIGAGGQALDTGAGGRLEGGSEAEAEQRKKEQEADEEEALEELDTSGILADDEDAGGMDFDPEDIIKAANEGGEDDEDGEESEGDSEEKGERE